MEGQNWRSKLQAFLRSYRTTPHSTTLFTPFRLLFGRDPKTKLPELSSKLHAEDDDIVRMRDKQAKQQAKDRADTRNRATKSDITVGDQVIVRRDEKPGKLETPYNPRPMHVKEKRGTMVTASRGKETITRNVSRFKKIPMTVISDDDSSSDIECQDNQVPEAEMSTPQTPVASPRKEPVPPQRVNTPQPATRPRRQQKTPAYLKDYVTWVKCYLRE